jgi:hypothetical protein
MVWTDMLKRICGSSIDLAGGHLDSLSLFDACSVAGNLNVME